MSDNEYYYSDRGKKRQGPLTKDKFFALVKSGTIDFDTKVWWTGMADFVPYSEVAEKKEMTYQAKEELNEQKDSILKECPECNNTVSLSDLTCPECGYR